MGGKPKKGEEQLDFAATRRGFLVAGVCAVSAAVGGMRFAMPDFGAGHSARFALGRLSDFKMNTLTWLRERELFVMHNEDGIGAFSARCTHLGCTVRRTAEGFVCPCHGAEFGPQGEVLSGPARRDLPWYEVWFESDGQLWVDRKKQLDGQGTTAITLVKPESE